MCALQTSQSKYASQIKHFPAAVFSVTFFTSWKLEVIRVLIISDVMSPLIIHISRDYLQPPDIITGCLQQPPIFLRFHSPQEVSQPASLIIFY